MLKISSNTLRVREKCSTQIRMTPNAPECKQASTMKCNFKSRTKIEAEKICFIILFVPL